MNSDKIVKETIQYIEKNLEQDLNLDMVAKKVGYSKFYLNRVFYKSVGYTIVKYIQLKRLTAAAQKLVYSEKPIIEIAYEAGYQSQQSFGHAFRKIYTLSPHVYRIKGIYRPMLGQYNKKAIKRVYYLRESGVIAA